MGTYAAQHFQRLPQVRISVPFITADDAGTAVGIMTYIWYLKDLGKQKISTSPQKCIWMPGSYKIWSTLWIKMDVSRGKITHRSPNMDYEMLKPFQGAPSTAPGLCIIYHPPLELMKRIRWNQQLFCLVAWKVNHLQQADDSHAKYQYLLVACKVSFRGFPGSTSTSLRISG